LSINSANKRTATCLLIQQEDRQIETAVWNPASPHRYLRKKRPHSQKEQRPRRRIPRQPGLRRVDNHRLCKKMAASRGRLITGINEKSSGAIKARAGLTDMAGRSHATLIVSMDVSEDNISFTPQGINDNESLNPARKCSNQIVRCRPALSSAGAIFGLSKQSVVHQSNILSVNTDAGCTGCQRFMPIYVFSRLRSKDINTCVSAGPRIRSAARASACRIAILSAKSFETGGPGKAAYATPKGTSCCRNQSQGAFRRNEKPGSPTDSERRNF